MAENARPPVAVRIARPFDTEEAFLEHELETIGKTSVILIGAHSRPAGVILRFEVSLSNGTVLLRGEGRVLAYKDNAFRGQAGLALRFTRLDPKSKAFIDRAVAMREARLTGEHRAAPPPPSSDAVAPAPASSGQLPPASLAPESLPAHSTDLAETAIPGEVALRPVEPPQAASVPPPTVEPRSVSIAPPTVEPRAVSVAPPTVEPAAVSVAPPPAPAPPAPAPASERKPSDRDALLARLRERAAGLSPERKASILGS